MYGNYGDYFYYPYFRLVFSFHTFGHLKLVVLSEPQTAFRAVHYFDGQVSIWAVWCFESKICSYERMQAEEMWWSVIGMLIISTLVFLKRILWNRPIKLFSAGSWRSGFSGKSAAQRSLHSCGTSVKVEIILYFFHFNTVKIRQMYTSNSVCHTNKNMLNFQSSHYLQHCTVFRTISPLTDSYPHVRVTEVTGWPSLGLRVSKQQRWPSTNQIKPQHQNKV